MSFSFLPLLNEFVQAVDPVSLRVFWNKDLLIVTVGPNSKALFPA